MGEGGAQRVVAERRWRLAMQSQAHPSTIMRDLLACLHLNQVSWKKQAPYNLKCRKAIGLSGTLDWPSSWYCNHALVQMQDRRNAEHQVNCV